jgi:hypothetical protein
MLTPSMKILPLLALLALSAGPVHGGVEQAPVRVREFKTPQGEVVKDVEFKKSDEVMASYKYRTPTAWVNQRVPMKDLPSDLQRKLGYDAAKAEEVLRKEEELRLSQRKDYKKKAAAEKKALDAQPVITAVAMSAKTGSAGKETTENWKTSWGSYDKDVTQSRGIAVRLRNGMDQAGIVYVEAIWLSNGSDGKGAASGISKVDRMRMALKPREITIGTLTASFSRSDSNYEAMGVRENYGKGYAGWIVRVIDPVNGKILASQASREPLMRWSDKVPVGKKADF